MSDTAAIDDLILSLCRMSDRAARRTAAREVAGRVGAEDLIIFIHDDVIGRSLPADGFEQTLQGSAAWRALLEEAIASKTADGTVSVAKGQLRHARAVGLSDGTVGVLLGETEKQWNLELLRALLPLLGALFRAEVVSRNKSAEAVLARQTAAQSAELATKLEAARTQLQSALNIADNASRARDEFLATVSHELRTPLTSVIGWVGLLRDERDRQVIGEGLDAIDRNARAQSRLIEDILDYSRISGGKLRLDVGPVDVIDLIKESLEVIRPATKAKDITVVSTLSPGRAMVLGDADRLQQIFWNLLSNAMKFTPRGGRIEVSARKLRDAVELTVSDSGAGIAPEFVPHVFERFSQADSSSTRRYGGLGLGLSIVRHLVELHGGSAEVSSAGIGRGSRFVISLPSNSNEGLAGELGSQSMEGTADSRQGPQLELLGRSVMVVEDSLETRNLLTLLLRRNGASVQPAEGADEALLMLEKDVPDLIISDIEMPNEDGYSFIRRVRGGNTGAHSVPAIALTAYTTPLDRARALEAGFQLHIGKPVDPTALIAAVRSLIRPNA